MWLWTLICYSSNKFCSWPLAFTKKVKEGQLSCCLQSLIKKKGVGRQEGSLLTEVGTSGVHLQPAKAPDPPFLEAGLHCLSRWAPLSQATLLQNLQQKSVNSQPCHTSNTVGKTSLFGCSYYDLSQMVWFHLISVLTATGLGNTVSQKWEIHLNTRTFGQEGCPWGTRCRWLQSEEGYRTSSQRQKIKWNSESSSAALMRSAALKTNLKCIKYYYNTSSDHQALKLLETPDTLFTT